MTGRKKSTVATQRRKTRARKAKANIVAQEVVREVQTKGFEVVRLSRVKYKDNDHTFIDVRFFSRGYDDDGDEIYHPTRKGVQLREDLFLKLVNQTVLAALKRLVRGTDG